MSYVSKLIMSLVISLFISSSSLADDLDTRLRIDQSIEQQNRNEQQELLKDEDYLQGSRPEITVNGKSYPIKHNVNDLGRALYLSIKQKQWQDALYFLNEYQNLAKADPLLLAYARGTLARVEGDMELAETEYRHLLSLNPDFLPGQLELARVLFEDHKDKEAKQVFEQISLHLDPTKPNQSSVLSTVMNFTKALKQRTSWTSSVSIGAIWNDNLNQSSESFTCFLYYQGQCIYDRTLPDSIKAHGVDYELTLNKQLAIKGHHGIYSRSLLYGQSYKDHTEFNERTTTSQFGYRFQDLNDHIRLAPSFELSSYGNQTIYGAWGLHSEWTRNVSNKRMFKVEADYKKLNYRRDSYSRYEGPTYSSNATAWQVLPDNWVLFGGVDWLESKANEKTLAYTQRGLRLGVSKHFSPNISAVLFASVRERNHHEFSKLLGEKRSDLEQSYTLVLKSPKLVFAGFTPNLTIRHRTIRSNVDWLYSHKRTQVSLKLESRF